MKNMVPCKGCGTEFEYIPGPAGNNRQLCEKCRSIFDEKELARLEEESIVEGNRYLMFSPKRKNEYDPTSILLDGEIPCFESDADRFVCAMEIGGFVRATGINAMEQNILKLLDELGSVHRMLFVRQLHRWQVKILVNLLPQPEKELPEWAEYIGDSGESLGTFEDVLK